MCHRYHNSCLSEHIQCFFYLGCLIVTFHSREDELVRNLHGDTSHGVTKQRGVNLLAVFREIILVGHNNIILYLLTRQIIMCLHPFGHRFWHTAYKHECPYESHQLLIEGLWEWLG